MSRPVEPGHVYLLGAGPGDPELLTVRAAAILAAADVVFHDRLVSEEVLAGARSARLVDVGHRAGGRGRDLSAVAAEMAAEAGTGQVVARLKGGDPFVFGRGAEELLELAALGVPCEVVPGVSSALAAPAAAGIPVTHRGLSRSIVVTTGHDGDPDRVQGWRHLRGATLVILMGSARLASLAAEVLDAGWDPQTPAAVVMAATTPRQRQLTGCLGEIAQLAAAAGLGPPSVLVVGEVVSIAKQLASGLAAGAGVGE